MDYIVHLVQLYPTLIFELHHEEITMTSKKNLKKRLDADMNVPSIGINGKVNYFDCCETINPISYGVKPTVPVTAESLPAHPWTYINSGLNWKVPMKEETMSYAHAIANFTHAAPQSDEMIQRDYLRRRLDNADSEKEDKAYKAFGLADDDRPRTFTDFIARIKTGKFTISDRYDADDEVYNPAENIRWRDPAIKEDKAGFKTFKEKLQADYDKAKDMIMISTPADGLKALQDFEVITIQ